MAFTTPTTRSTGLLVTASIWNVDLVDNIIFLKAEVDKVHFSTGTYTGNNSANRTIPHGLSTTPKAVYIINTDFNNWFRIFTDANIYMEAGTGSTKISVTAPDGTNFHVGNSGDFGQSANNNTQGYRWVAIG